MKTIPKILKYMTTMPHTIGQAIPITTASEMMKTHGIRHLPVQEAGKLVGILTERDIRLAMNFQGGEKLKVEDVMTSDPFAVRPDAPLDFVVTEMAEHRYGCAVVQQENGKVVGIFTAVDGLRVLGEVLHQNYKS